MIPAKAPIAREGCRIVQLPVEHRPRPHGRSHYNLWNRSLNVVIDLLGVAWLMRRPIRAASPSPAPMPPATAARPRDQALAAREPRA